MNYNLMNDKAIKTKTEKKKVKKWVTKKQRNLRKKLTQ
jgi:hypothetical protein